MKPKTEDQNAVRWAGYIDGIWVVYGVPASYVSDVRLHPHIIWPVAETLEAYDEDQERVDITDAQRSAIWRAWTRRAPNIATI